MTEVLWQQELNCCEEKWVISFPVGTGTLQLEEPLEEWGRQCQELLCRDELPAPGGFLLLEAPRRKSYTSPGCSSLLMRLTHTQGIGIGILQLSITLPFSQASYLLVLLPESKRKFILRATPSRYHSMFYIC